MAPDMGIGARPGLTGGFVPSLRDSIWKTCSRYCRAGLSLFRPSDSGGIPNQANGGLECEEVGRLNFMRNENELCALCGCTLHRSGEYATPTRQGRSHATKHHFVAERFFGRSTNRRGLQREGIFTVCPWEHEGETAVYCYECHEELLHNPVLLPEDIAAFAALVKARGFAEDKKPEGREKISGRIRLFHEVIAAGLQVLSEPQPQLPHSSQNRA